MLYDIFSKRKKRSAGDSDVYSYDDIPQQLRVQLVHVLKDVLSTDDAYTNQLSQAAKAIQDALVREYGLFTLSDDLKYDGDYVAALFNFMLKTKDVEQVLDVVEFALRAAVPLQESYFRERPVIGVDDAIAEVNARFREHAVGYQYESGVIVRVDSTLVHQEVIKPALLVLRQPYLAGANEEFLKAHEHYRNGRYKECINECLKSFESTMKAICAKRKWKVDSNATASRLIDVCFSNQLVPAYLQSEFSALRSSLESGVPTVRNRTSGHGQGSQPMQVPEYIAAYLLHSTAAVILLLTRAEAELA